MRIYLIRHGDPDYRNDSLTESGRLEAEALSVYLKSIEVDRLYSSPLGRARATASFSEETLGLKAEVLDWTAELELRSNDGSSAAWDTNPVELRAMELDENQEWKNTVQRIAASSDQWLEGLGWRRNGCGYKFISPVSSDKELQVAVFCHGGFGLTWLSHLLNIPVTHVWSSFFLHTSSVTTVLFDEREPSVATPRIISLSSLPHLYHAGLTPSTA